jgi:hypothetical protein
MIAFLGKILVALLIIVAVLGAVGLVWLIRRSRKEKVPIGQLKIERDVFSEETAENVAALNDRFNRARYMDEDGK